MTEFNDITLLKLSAFFHDVGKIKGIKNHELTGADIFEKSISKELSLGSRATKFVSRLIKHHLDVVKLYFLREENKDISEEINFFWYENRDIAGHIFVLTLADIYGTSEDDQFLDKIKLFIIYLQEYYFDFYTKNIIEKPLLSGKEIMEILDLPQSPLIGRIKQQLLKKQIKGEIKTKDQAVSFIRSLKL